MKFTVIAMTLLLATLASAQWSENFDSYALGSGLIGQGGWEGWDGATTCDAYVTDAQALSAPHAIEISPTSDMVQEFNIESGAWTITASNYIPSGSYGKQYFILLTLYEGPDSEWALDLLFDSDIDQVSTVEGVNTATIIYDQWVNVKVEFNLGTNTQSIYYNDVLMETIDWSAGGILYFDAIDLFSDGGSSIYWDDLDLVEEASLTPTTWAYIKATIK